MPRTKRRLQQLHDLSRARAHRLLPSATLLMGIQLEYSALKALQPEHNPGSKAAEFAQIRETTIVGPQVGEISGAASLQSLEELTHVGRQNFESFKAGIICDGDAEETSVIRRPSTFTAVTRRPTAHPKNRHRIRYWGPVCALAPQITQIYGMEYQQGTLFVYSAREYLVEKGGDEFSYCYAKDIYSQIELAHLKAQGRSARITKRGHACQSGNQGKGRRLDSDILANVPKRLIEVAAKTNASLRNAAAAKPTSEMRPHGPECKGLPMEIFSCVSIQFNSSTLGITKTFARGAESVATVEAFKRVASSRGGDQGEGLGVLPAHVFWHWWHRQLRRTPGRKSQGAGRTPSCSSQFFLTNTASITETTRWFKALSKGTAVLFGATKVIMTFSAGLVTEAASREVSMRQIQPILLSTVKA